MRQRIDQLAVPQVRGDPSGGRVGVAEVPELLERGHLAADGGGRDVQAVAFGDGFAAHRLPRPDELLDDGVQDRGLARPERF